MGRWTGTWLSGIGAAGVAVRPEGDWRGRRLGLPAQGPGSVATFGRRLVAFVVDAVICGGVAGLFTAPRAPGTWSFLPLGLLYLVAVPLLGQTVGMRLLGLRIVHVGGGRPEGDQRSAGRPTLFLPPLAALIRFALLCLLIPAVIANRDGRGLHDRLARTAVVRS